MFPLNGSSVNVNGILFKKHHSTAIINKTNHTKELMLTAHVESSMHILIHVVGNTQDIIVFQVDLMIRPLVCVEMGIM